MQPERDVQPAFSYRCGTIRLLRILVAEDESRLSRQLATALQEATYAVDTAADGVEGDRQALVGGSEGGVGHSISVASSALLGCH